MRIKMLSPLQIKDFRNLFFAQMMSDLGNWFDFIAINTLMVYTWGLGASSVAAFTITFALPSVIIGPLAGVWIDRLPKRYTMVLMDGCRALLVIGLFFAPNLFYLLPLVFLKGCGTSIFNPARQSTLRMILSRDQLSEAISLSQLSVQSSKILAPILGAIVVGALGSRSVFLVEAGLFIISVIFLFQLPSLKPKLTFEGQESKRYWAHLREGLQHIVTKKALFFATLAMAMALFITFMYDGFFPLWTKSLGMSESAFGLILSAIGFGSVLGAILIGHFTKWREWPLTMMACAALIAGMTVMTMGLGSFGLIDGNVVVWFFTFLLLGASSSFAFIGFGYILQTETEENMMGRVSALANAVQNTAILVSPSIGAVILKLTNVGVVFGGAGMVLACFGAALIVVSVRIRKREGVRHDSRKMGM